MSSCSIFSKSLNFLLSKQFFYDSEKLVIYNFSRQHNDSIVEEDHFIYWYVADHLGNVRLSYFNNGSSTEVLEENNYYQFSLEHEGYNASVGNLSYQYKYNGKELQETGMYDYGARFYMADIGRWGVLDPLAEKMTRHGPYNYAFNNPIRFIDPDKRNKRLDKEIWNMAV
mgnify:CR=1 FL=1